MEYKYMPETEYFNIQKKLKDRTELLEACKSSLNWHHGDKWRNGTVVQQIKWTKHTERLEQAIAKAEGK